MTPSDGITQSGAACQLDGRMGHRSLSNCARHLRGTFLPRRSYAPFFSLLATLILTVSGLALPVTWTPASGNIKDVASAINSAHDGDTVTIPAGTWTWTSGLIITKGITLQGATTITGDHTTPMSATDGTIIVDNVARVNSGSYGRVLLVAITNQSPFRVTGITFQGDPSNPNFNWQHVNQNGGLFISGCQSLRIDHCHFNQLQANGVIDSDNNLGVIDHCIHDPSSGVEFLYVFNNKWGGGSNDYGDGSWADAPYLGSNKFLFIEDNTLNNTTGIQTAAAVDSWAGGRYVLRYNTMNNMKVFNHGTESPGRARSCRVMEIYNNKITFNTSPWPSNGGTFRGGTGVVHDNAYFGNFDTPVINLQAYREFEAFPYWIVATGYNPWDNNDPNGAYLTGTHTGSSGATTVTSSVTLTAGQWVGYQLANTRTKRASYITANSTTTITYAYDTSFDPAGNLKFDNGDGFGIYKIISSLDQPGRGKGDLLSSLNPINTTTGTVAWPHQALEPIYGWNNTYKGKYQDILWGLQSSIQVNRDFYNNPKDTPMPGYTPYTYPHPLVSGASPSPTPPPLKVSAPKNLRIGGQ